MLQTGCSDWALRIAKDMNPRTAKAYLEKARKHWRDPLNTSFVDRLRDLPIEYQLATYNRNVFASWILQSTMEDEPEAPPIDVINTVDDEPCPAWEFVYSNQMVRGDGVPKPLTADQKEGCSCLGSCPADPTKCACVRKQDKYSAILDVKGFLYNAEGRLVEEQLPIFECNDACSCACYCTNRVRTKHV